MYYFEKYQIKIIYFATTGDHRSVAQQGGPESETRALSWCSLEPGYSEGRGRQGSAQWGLPRFPCHTELLQESPSVEND